MSKCRKGFTTIELVVAISILVLLMSMLVIGFNVLGARGKTTATKIALESGKSLFSELDAAGGISRIKNLYRLGGADRYFDPIPAPGLVGADISEIRDQYRAELAFKRTNPTLASIMRVLQSMPNNRRIIENLPAERIARAFDPKDPKSEAILLLDGWGNPIIFVPPGGMAGVKYETVQEDGSIRMEPRRVTTAGIIDPADPLPPGVQPFFASAGADGDFSTGDDNVYSFEN